MSMSKDVKYSNSNVIPHIMLQNITSDKYRASGPRFEIQFPEQPVK